MPATALIIGPDSRPARTPARSSVTGWTFGNATSFDFVIDLNTYGQQTYNPAPADTNGSVAYWDQADGHFSAFNAIPGALGNDQFAIASDPSHNNAAIQQVVGGLQIGDRYQLTFSQAATQQYGYSGTYNGRLAGQPGHADADGHDDVQPRRLRTLVNGNARFHRHRHVGNLVLPFDRERRRKPAVSAAGRR